MTAKSHYITILADYNRDGKLLLKIRRPYAGEWALAEGAESAVADSGAESGSVGDEIINFVDAQGDGADGGTSQEAAISADAVPGDAPETGTAADFDEASEGEAKASGDLDFLDAEIAELEGLDAEPADDELDLPDDIGQESKAAKRFQTLANQVRELKTLNQNFEHQMRETSNYAQQMQQWAQTEVARATAQVQALAQQQQQFYAQPQQPQVDMNDPVEQLKAQMMSEAETKWAQKFEAQEQRLAQLEQRGVQKERQAVLNQKAAQHKAASYRAAEQIALKGMPEEMVAQMREHTAAQILTTALYQQTTVEEAAKMHRLHNLKTMRALMQSGSKNLQTSLAKSKAAPPTASGQPNVRGNGVKVPTEQELQRDGYVGITALSDWAIDHGVVLPG